MGRQILPVCPESVLIIKSQLCVGDLIEGGESAGKEGPYQAGVCWAWATRPALMTPRRGWCGERSGKSGERAGLTLGGAGPRRAVL